MHEAYAGIARQWYDTRPHKALSAINMALNKKFTEPSYFYWKARILSRLSGDSYAIRNLEREDKNITQKQLDEIDALVAGKAMRTALHYATIAVENAPGNNTYLCFRTELLVELGFDFKAREEYEAMLKTNPDNHEALYGLGLLLVKLGRENEHQRALELFDRAIKLEPIEARYHAAKAKTLSGDPERYVQAVESYNTAIPLDKLAWRTVLEFAVLLENNDDLPGAIDNYRRCLLIHRECLPAASSMGRLLYRSKPVAALVYIDQAIRLDPQGYIHHAYRGCILYKLGREEDAAEAFAEAKNLAGKKIAGASFKFAQILFPDMPEQALEYCRLAVKEAPKNSDYLILEGDIHAATGDEDAALESYNKALEFTSRSHAAMYRCAKVLRSRGDAKCAALIGSAIAAAPRIADYHLLLADIQETLLNDPSAALKAVENAAGLEPDNVEIRQRMVELVRKNRKFLSLPAERLKLSKAMRKREEKLAAMQAEAEVSFEDEEPEAAKNPIVNI
jgi:tetratricopeptide (TPR) repeat protein